MRTDHTTAELTELRDRALANDDPEFADICQDVVTAREGECPHRTPPWLPYMADQADARRRMKRKESQRRCPVCGLWIWGEYWPAGEGG